ncbi:MAG: hypothetical protein IPG61_20170 [bacterium]|nr:hypothetical protein [bacterium]
MPNTFGDPDMDGDGIGHWADPDELAAYRNAQVALVSAVRDSLGEGFIQFFNGQRAYSDSTFAGLADGPCTSFLPTLGFPQPNMQNALNPSFLHNLYAVRNRLRDQNGGPWIVMSNPWRNQYADQNNQVTLLQTGNQFRVVAMLMDGFASWNSNDGSTFSYTYGWPANDICVGEPIGPPVYEGNFIRRDFQYGRVELEWKTGRYPHPFKYKVWSLGEIVEELRCRTTSRRSLQRIARKEDPWTVLAPSALRIAHGSSFLAIVPATGASLGAEMAAIS